MTAVIAWLEAFFESIPLPFLEVWGRFSYLVGLALALCAFSGFTFRIGDRWGFGRERQTWDTKAFLNLPLTFVLIIAAGYLGSFIVLVPGAQTFESLKDLVVLLCIVLFGYPALLVVPPAYMLSDLIEGVPPEFVLSWAAGYFFWTAFVWMASQLIGRNPDFRRLGTWGRYGMFVVLIMLFDPVMWGFICSGEFTASISYRNISSALAFTLAVTWILAPAAFLIALPVARRFGWLWAEIPGHVRQRPMGSREWTWVSGREHAAAPGTAVQEGVPIRVFIFTPFIALVLVMVATTSIVALRSADDDATRLAVRLHQEASSNIRMRLDEYLKRTTPAVLDAQHRDALVSLLRTQAIGSEGRAFILDDTRAMVASSAPEGDAVVRSAIAALSQHSARAGGTPSEVEIRFDHVTARPLSRETWLTYATTYRVGSAGRHWILVTAMPEASYLAGLRIGNSRAAMVFALALVISLVLAAALASMVTAPLRRVARATETLARGDLTVRVPDSRLEELGTLSQSFNDMAGKLETSFDDLVSEVDVRKTRERELRDSEARLRMSEGRLQMAVDAAGLGIWDWDVAQNRVHWDQSMYRLYGLREEEFSGAFEAWTKCLVPEDAARTTSEVEAALRGDRQFTSEFRIRRGDAAIRTIRGVGQILRAGDGQPIRMVGINWDVTDLRAAEREREQQQERLEALVASRTAELRAAKDAAESASRAKSTFLANMSHEIRTPMNAVLGYAELLRRDHELNDRQQQRIDIIHSSGSHLLTLINDILEMSKIEAGRTTLATEPFDLHALLVDVRLMFRELTEARSIELVFEQDTDLPRVLIGDAGKIRQVVINLLSNAVKFTERGRIAVLTSSRDAGADRRLVAITVEDTGLGIEPANLTRIFDAFDQADSKARAGGTGLGLAISRNFARLMNGEVVVESTPGAGSVFTFSFEAGAAPVHVMPTSVDQFVPVGLDTAERPRKVLIVDDVPANRALIEELLARTGFQTKTAASGEDAQRVHDEWHPDLVFMDLRMPGMGGLHAIRQLRSRGSTVAIVAITASGLPEDAVEARQAGVDAIVRKPYRESELLAVVGRLLRVRYVYESTEVRPSDHVKAEADRTTLSQRLSTLPAVLINELREAAIQGRAKRLESLAEEAARHSHNAAAEIRALASEFQYDALVSALQTLRPSSVDKGTLR